MKVSDVIVKVIDLFDEWGMPFLGASAIVTVAVLLGLWIKFEIEHPCIRSEQYACTSTRCAIWHTNAKGIMSCMMYESYPDTCTRCLERKP